MSNALRSDTDATTIVLIFHDNNDSLMPKLRLIGLTLLALSATAVSHAEETRYVSDELNTWSVAVREIIIASWARLTPARK